LLLAKKAKKGEICLNHFERMAHKFEYNGPAGRMASDFDAKEEKEEDMTSN
jgi:hypothetical protein